MDSELFYWIKQLNNNAYQAGITSTYEDQGLYDYHTEQQYILLSWIRKKLKESIMPLNRFKQLYITINKMMMKLGAEGEIGTRAVEVLDVMDALKELDGGVFDVDVAFKEE